MVSSSVTRRRLAMLVLVAAPVVVAPVVVTAQNVITLRADSASRIIAPSGKLAVPVILDMSAAGGTNLASLTTGVTFGSSRLTFDSVKAASFGTLTSNTAGAATGNLTLGIFDAVGTTTTQTLATMYFTASATAGGTTIAFSPTVAGTDAGVNILSMLRAQVLGVCVASSGGKWGDVNGDSVATPLGDGSVNIIDAQQIARYSVGLTVSNRPGLVARGDVTADGAVNIIDAQQIARFSVGLSASARVNTATFSAPVANVLVTPSTPLGLALGATLQLTAVPRDASGGSLAACQPVTWASSNQGVATVSTTGLVTAVAAGTTTVTATSGGTIASVTVVVMEYAKYLAVSSLNTWYLKATGVEPYLMFDVTSERITSNYGNFGMRFNNEIPRTPYANISSGGDRTVAETPWYGQYGALGAANDALTRFKAGVTLSTAAETDQYKTLAMFTQALSLSELGLIFDKAFVLDENSTGTPAFVPYPDVITAAMAKWDAVIAASDGKSYAFPSSVLPLAGVTFSGSTLNRIANTMAARTLAYSARSLAETQTLSWARILGYADKGISGSGLTPFDFSVIGDGYVNWYADAAGAANSTWGIPVDVKTINMMDPTVPATFNGTMVAPGAVHDLRLGATSQINYNTYQFTPQPGVDFSYEAQVVGNPARGIWKQSPYWYFRYYSYGWDQSPGAEGPMPYTLIAENDLLIAEALARTGGDLARAATLINKTRVTRGGLVPATAGDGAATLLQYIAYENDIELMTTGANGLYERRRIDNLQSGTPRHLPVPAKVLEALGLPVYTFGGPGNPTGK